MFYQKNVNKTQVAKGMWTFKCMKGKTVRTMRHLVIFVASMSSPAELKSLSMWLPGLMSLVPMSLPMSLPMLTSMMSSSLLTY